MHIVYNLINGLLGGKITLTSTPDSGTRICVILPLNAPVLEDEAVAA
jgi:signal transduction histidine kinase